MQSAMTILTIVGGLLFSVSCALLVEELIFGGLFRFMAARVPVGGDGQKSAATPARFVKYTHMK